MSHSYDLIIVGGGLTGLTAAYRAQQRGWKFLLLEASERLGGSLETLHSDGLLQELGAESMVTAKPWGKDLILELGLGDQLVSPQPEFHKTLIVRGGQLVPIPEGLRLLAPSQWIPFLRSPAVSWLGKLRMGLEFFVKPRQDVRDESLASFVRRRLGKEALERIAQPMVAGIYTADPETLSMRATLPQFLEYERKYGSVCRGLLLSPEARASRGPRYHLFNSLIGGFGQLIQALRARLPDESIRCGRPVGHIRPLEDGWQVDGETAPRLLLAAPTYAMADLLRPFDAPAASLLQKQEYLSSATVNLGYPLTAADAATRGYGFVVPAVEGRDILACTFSHRKYPERTPPDMALLRTYVGGASRPEAMAWNDEEMIARSHMELSRLLKIGEPPISAVVKRYVRAMPLYRVGHLEWLSTLEDCLARWPGLGWAGNAYRGVGIPDCVRSANEAVARLG
ncbi:MAG: protoporphyrinogen oxidase [Candidatus Eremiobacteraeota bacterium]|nr:protoporphyrinogen oxidase [Candidatus Eremiobacteraeota bacterium]